jgi:2-polyprenyl-6-methoxyphenol hydroxylase-like FAD-dependent oxidoreductase
VGLVAKRVLVSGAGIAGLAAGIALRRAGHYVEIVETRSGAIAEGVGLCLPGNALRALRELGVLEAVAAAGFAYDHNIFCDGDGQVLTRIPCRIAAKDTPVTIGIRRSDLQRILLAAAERAGGRIAYDTSIAEVVSSDQAALVRFSDGRAGSYDLVVGCDGVHSTLRQQVAPGSSPAHANAAAWRVVAPRHESVTAATLYCRPDGRAGLIPLDGDTMYFLAIAPAKAGERHDRLTLHKKLAEILSGYGGLFPDLAGQLDSVDGIVYSPIEDVLVPGRWYRGRILLMGDAAHATTPYLTQGVGMALEDAVVLAEVLTDHHLLADCFEAFMRHRYERCRFVQQTSRRLLLAEVADPAADGDTVLERVRRMLERFAVADAILDRSPFSTHPIRC